MFQNGHINHIVASIDKACQGSGYSCKRISWDDSTRFNNNGFLSSVGPNISDVRLVSKNGTSLYTVRPENFNEKVGTVNASEVCVIDSSDNKYTPVTLETYLKKQGIYSETLDSKISIRFQTSFLPVPKENQDIEDFSLVEEQSIEFCPEMYNYNTSNNDDPKNLIVLSTNQGLSIEKNARGYQKLFLKSIDPLTGLEVSHWISAEKTDFKVGQEQKEDEESVKHNLSLNKAVSSVIGIKAMGTRFNALMTIQVPLKQKNTGLRGGFGNKEPMFAAYDSFSPNHTVAFYNQSLDKTGFFEKSLESMQVEVNETNGYIRSKMKSIKARQEGLKGGRSSIYGQSNAARISRGSASETGQKAPIDTKSMTRDPEQHITITVVIYNTIEGLTIPTEEDIKNAIAELEGFYASCTKTQFLSETTFMHKETMDPIDKQFLHSFHNKTPVPVVPKHGYQGPQLFSSRETWPNKLQSE